MTDELNILILEDDFTTSKLYQSILKHHNVVIVETPEEALLELVRKPYDIMIVDIQLRGSKRTGVSLLDLYLKFQEKQFNNKLNIIVSTAYRPEDYGIDSNQYKVIRKADTSVNVINEIKNYVRAISKRR